MADGIEFDLSDLNRLAVDLGKVPAKMVPMARAVLEKSSADIERDGKIFAPVDTGNLRNSISRDLKGLTAEIGPTANYGAHVEYGTSRQGPAAYMGPAFDRHAGLFVEALGQITEKLL
jgi:HK97 gp10 family phage protein